MNVKPVAVRDLLRKGRGDTFNLCLIRGAEQPSASNWILNDMKEKLQALEPGLEVAEYDLSKMHIAPCIGCYGGGGRVCYLPCQRNDIESEIYDAKDEMLKVHESVKECDALLIGTDVRWSQPAHFTSLFIERLNPFANLAAAGRPAITKPKPVALAVVNGDNGHAGSMIAALNAIGFMLPQHGFVTFQLPRMITREGARSAYKKASDLQREMDLVVTDLAKFGKE